MLGAAKPTTFRGGLPAEGNQDRGTETENSLALLVLLESLKPSMELDF